MMPKILNYLSVFVNFNSVICRSFEKAAGIYEENKLILLVYGIYVKHTIVLLSHMWHS